MQKIDRKDENKEIREKNNIKKKSKSKSIKMDKKS